MKRRRRLSRCCQYLPVVKSTSIPTRTSKNIRRRGPTAPIRIWNFPRDICQSRICGRKEASSACVIIALLTAVERLRPDAKGVQLSPVLDPVFANSLVENFVLGNELYDSSAQHRRITGRLIVPDAMELMKMRLGEEYALAEISHVTKRDARLTVSTFARYVREVVGGWGKKCAKESARRRSWPSVCFIVIARRRAVLFTYQASSGTLLIVDSHSHGNRSSGALVAASKLSDSIKMLTEVLSKIYPRKRRAETINQESFEVSVLSSVS